MGRILVIEDDERMARELCTLLRSRGHEAGVAAHDRDYVEQVREAGADIVLLDLGLPGIDGTLVAKSIRDAGRTGIIVVTSRATEVDEVMCIGMGADDFVAKPYSPHVLLARIEALLRRFGLESHTELRVGPVSYDPETARLTGPSGEESLTRNEGRILACLMRGQGRIMSREQLMCELWDSDAFVDDNTLSVNVARVRQKLEKVGAEGMLATHRGQGYSINGRSEVS